VRRALLCVVHFLNPPFFSSEMDKEEVIHIRSQLERAERKFQDLDNRIWVLEELQKGREEEKMGVKLPPAHLSASEAHLLNTPIEITLSAIELAEDDVGRKWSCGHVVTQNMVDLRWCTCLICNTCICIDSKSFH